MTLASNYAAWGKPEKARGVLQELEARRTREYIQPAMLAGAAASTGDLDLAIEFARQAVEIGDPMFLMLARSWPDYNAVRSEPRFLETMGQLNLPDWP